MSMTISDATIDKYKKRYKKYLTQYYVNRYDCNFENDSILVYDLLEIRYVLTDILKIDINELSNLDLEVKYSKPVTDAQMKQRKVTKQLISSHVSVNGFA